MDSYSLSPRLSYRYSVSGNPVVTVEAKDRSGKELIKSSDYVASLYSPYLQFFMRKDEESEFELITDYSINPVFEIYPESEERYFEVLVKIWDKMPFDDDYDHFDEATVIIKIPTPTIGDCVIQDCRRRVRDCTETMDAYDLASITGEVSVSLIFVSGYHNLQRIDVYGSTDSKNFPLDEEHYIKTYWTSGGQVQSFAITELEPYFDYYLTFVPYDNMGAGTPYRDGYGYLCPDEEVNPCVSVQCIDFFAYSEGENTEVIREDTCFHKFTSEQPIDYDLFSTHDWHTAIYNIQATSESGNSHYIEYQLTANDKGDYVDGNVGGQHTEMIASPLELKVRHLVSASQCLMSLEAGGEGFSNDRRQVTYGANDNYVKDTDETIVSYAYDQAPRLLIEGEAILEYNELLKIEFTVPTGTSETYLNQYTNAHLCTRQKIVVPAEYESQEDVEYWQYDSFFSSSSFTLSRDQVNNTVSYEYTFPMVSTEPFASNQGNALVFEKTEAREMFFNLTDGNGNSIPWDKVTFFKAKKQDSSAGRRLLKVAQLTSAGTEAFSWVGSLATVSTYGNFNRQYSYPFLSVRPPQESRTNQNEPDINSTVNLFADGWILVGDIFDTEEVVKLSKLWLAVSNSSIADEAVNKQLKLEVNKIGDNGGDVLWTTSGYAKKETVNGQVCISFDEIDIPYDSNSDLGWRFYLVDDDGVNYKDVLIRCTSNSETLSPEKVKYLYSFSTKSKVVIPPKVSGMPPSYRYTGKRLGAFAYAEPYYLLKYPVHVKSFKKLF